MTGELRRGIARGVAIGLGAGLILRALGVREVPLELGELRQRLAAGLELIGDAILEGRR